MLRNVNLKNELQQERALRESPGAMGFVYAMFDALNDEVYQEHQIQQTLQASAGKQAPVYPIGVRTEDVYLEQDIRRICVKYRLRFLESSQFTGALPYEALRKIKQVQKQAGQTLTSFHIAAPAEAFHLPNCEEDPLLFADLGHGRYLLIHHWGNDLSRWRSIRNYPVRNRRTLLITVAVRALVLTAALPLGLAELHAGEQAGIAKAAFACWSFAGIAAIVAAVLFKRMKGFSSDVWKRPFS